jgi:hypothetical protein
LSKNICGFGGPFIRAANHLLYCRTFNPVTECNRLHLLPAKDRQLTMLIWVAINSITMA